MKEMYFSVSKPFVYLFGALSYIYCSMSLIKRNQGFLSRCVSLSLAHFATLQIYIQAHRTIIISKTKHLISVSLPTQQNPPRPRGFPLPPTSRKQTLRGSYGMSSPYIPPKTSDRYRCSGHEWESKLVVTGSV